MTPNQRAALEVAYEVLGKQINVLTRDKFLDTWRTPDAQAEYVRLSKAYRELGSMLAQKELL